MNELSKSAQIDAVAAGDHPVCIEIVAFENLPRVVDGVHDRALAGTVGAKQECDRADRNDNRLVAGALEVLDRYPCDHGGVNPLQAWMLVMRYRKGGMWMTISERSTFRRQMPEPPPLSRTT